MGSVVTLIQVYSIFSVAVYTISCFVILVEVPFLLL
jgi:hypothetical protein